MSVAENLDSAVVLAVDDASFSKQFGRNNRSLVEHVEDLYVYYVVSNRKFVVETTFGKTTCQGSLSAFEAGANAAAAAGPLTLVTLTACFAEAASDTSTQSLFGGISSYGGLNCPVQPQGALL